MNEDKNLVYRMDKMWPINVFLSDKKDAMDILKNLLEIKFLKTDFIYYS